MTAGLIQCASDQPSLKAPDFIVEIYALGKIQRSQPMGFFSESFVTGEVLGLSQQRIREIKQALHAVSRRSFSYS
jgi:hypothetical protein